MSEIIERNVIKSLVSSYLEEKEKIERSLIEFSKIDPLVFSLAFEEHYIESSFQRRSSNIYELMKTEYLNKKLSQKYWTKAFEISKVRTVMPSERIVEWNEQIEKGDFPEFNMENVFSTIFEFFSGRRKYMAEKVEGILKSLSPNHKTNMSDQITEKFIFENMVFPKNYKINRDKSEKINDLRSLIRQLQGVDEYQIISSDSMIMDFYHNHSGEWNYVDGNAFRIKVYKKGTAHIELHPELVEEMSILLSELYPMQISNKEEFKKRRKEFKDYELLKDIISVEVCNLIISNLKTYINPFIKYDFYRRENNYPQKLKEINEIISKNDLNFEFENVSYKNIPKELINIMKLIGVEEQRYEHLLWFSADYDAINILRKIAYQGWIEDYKSYQFYPTKKELAEKLIDYASFETGKEKVLEPSSGQGGLCKFIPVDKENIDCVEISKINQEILKLKGYKVIDEDFLKFSVKTKKRYDRIIMNPPFSKGRAETHVKQAFSLLNEGGNVTAIVPASMKDKVIIKNATHTYSEVFNDNFDNTKVAVVIVRIEI